MLLDNITDLEWIGLQGYKSNRKKNSPSNFAFDYHRVQICESAVCRMVVAHADHRCLAGSPPPPPLLRRTVFLFFGFGMSWISIT